MQRMSQIGRTLPLLGLVALVCLWATPALAQLEALPPIEAPRATSFGAEDLSPIVPDSPLAGGTSTPGFAQEGIAWESTTTRRKGGFPSIEPCADPRFSTADDWTWQILPAGLVYRAYLAGVKESRLASIWTTDLQSGGIWDITLGGHVGLLRYGNQNPFFPKGWQLDLEGAATPRLIPSEDRDLNAADFRAGIPLTYSSGPWEYRFGYYHLSSHLGDEFLIKNPGYPRLNFSRDCLLFGVAYRPTPDVRLYVEPAWAFLCDGGSRPWEVQFGIDIAPAAPTGWQGGPFVALNGYLRQQQNFSGNFVAQCGWCWRGMQGGHLFRAGFEYYNGKSRQFSYYNRFEQQLGAGLWYDF